MKVDLRIIVDKKRTADFNMAADLYLLEQCREKDTVFIRFYSWQRPSVTIGYMQNPSGLLNFRTLKEKKGQWIRRPTGGRAVLHENDITYSCIFSKRVKPMGDSIAQTYRIITDCLMDGLKRAQIDCDAHDSYDELREVGRDVKLPCFLAPNRDEIMVKKRKLVGSAQKRVLNGVLQHGSIPLCDAYTELPNLLNIPEVDKDRQIRLLKRKGTYIREWVPDATFESIVECLIRGFTSKLPWPAQISPWSSEEQKRIQKLAGSEEFQGKWMAIEETESSSALQSPPPFSPSRTEQESA
ncbi:MAG: biotin/lipoate A/B protein ligase family protein [Chitinispirillaceae bacterium]